MSVTPRTPHKDVGEELDAFKLEMAQQLTSMRALLVEVQMSLLVKASRIALRSTELTSEERRVALLSLADKEKALHVDISTIRKRLERKGVGSTPFVSDIDI